MQNIKLERSIFLVANIDDGPPELVYFINKYKNKPSNEQSFSRTVSKEAFVKLMFAKSQSGILRLSTYFNIVLYMALYCDRAMFYVDPATLGGQSVQSVVSGIICKKLQDFNITLLSKKLPYPVVTSLPFTELFTIMSDYLLNSDPLTDKYA